MSTYGNRRLQVLLPGGGAGFGGIVRVVGIRSTTKKTREEHESESEEERGYRACQQRKGWKSVSSERMQCGRGRP